ncbi:MAG: TIGR02391 family protein [Pseudonocardiaceae bacterium]
MPRARTDTEALARSRRLHGLLVERGAHDDLIGYCRAELLAEDYYQAVFEAIKGLGARLRELSGIDLDGHRLVDAVLFGREPLLKINLFYTQTERDEQLGVANLAKGLFSAFRNPTAHEPRIHWQLSEQDALDVFSTLSLIHRRLDAARR